MTEATKDELKAAGVILLLVLGVPWLLMGFMTYFHWVLSFMRHMPESY